MKKTIIAALAVALTFASCAKEKKFTRSNGTQFAAKPYGWATKEDKNQRCGIRSLYIKSHSFGCLFGNNRDSAGCYSNRTMADEYAGFREAERREFIDARKEAASYQGSNGNDDWWLRNLPKDRGCEQGGC